MLNYGTLSPPGIMLWAAEKKMSTELHERGNMYHAHTSTVPDRLVNTRVQ